MSFSIPSACLPEIRRRPTMSAAFRTPTTRIASDDPRERRRAALLLDAVDRLADEQDDRDRRRLREDGEDRRDDERALVRPQESEQADERAAIRDGAHVIECSRRSSRFTCVSAFPSRARLAGSFSQPLAPDGMRQRDHDRVAARIALADRIGQRRDPEQAPKREPADGDDQVRPQQLELPVAPELAELLLAWRRRAVAAARRRAPGVAAGDGGAVEGLVQLVALEPEPAAELLPGAAAPRQPLLAFDDPRRLAEEIRALAGVRGSDRPRLERVARLHARPAARVVTLERRGASGTSLFRARHARTATNQRPREQDLAVAELGGELLRLEEALVDLPARAVVETRSCHSTGSTSSRSAESTTTSSGATRRASARKATRSSSSRWP